MAIQRYTKGERVFDVFNHIIMILLCITTLYPFLTILSLSLSDTSVSTSGLNLIPSVVTFKNFAKVFENPLIASGYLYTLIRTIVGTALSLVFTFSMAYVLSKKYFPHRTFWTAIVVFTMFFEGGLIPSYILIKNLHMIDSVWSLILPGLIDAFNLVIVRNFMMGIPDSLEEAARIDGANDIQILTKVILPLCKPILATIALWVAVKHWNSWFDSMIYITDPHKQVMQLVMRKIVLEGSAGFADLSMAADKNKVVATENLKAATIMVTTIPILMVYPFIQKYFVKGVMVGSVKG